MRRGARWQGGLPGGPPARRPHGGPRSVLRGVGPRDAVRRFGVDRPRGGGPRGVDPRGVVRHGVQTFEVWRSPRRLAMCSAPGGGLGTLRELTGVLRELFKFGDVGGCWCGATQGVGQGRFSCCLPCFQFGPLGIEHEPSNRRSFGPQFGLHPTLPPARPEPEGPLRQWPTCTGRSLPRYLSAHWQVLKWSNNVTGLPLDCQAVKGISSTGTQAGTAGPCCLISECGRPGRGGLATVAVAKPETVTLAVTRTKLVEAF